MIKKLYTKVNTESEKELEFKYFLTLNEDYDGNCSYGVEVQSKIIEPNGEELFECELCSNISDVKEDVLDILELLARFTVTPCGLVYALDEFLSW